MQNFDLQKQSTFHQQHQNYIRAQTASQSGSTRLKLELLKCTSTLTSLRASWLTNVAALRERPTIQEIVFKRHHRNYILIFLLTLSVTANHHCLIAQSFDIFIYFSTIITATVCYLYHDSGIHALNKMSYLCTLNLLKFKINIFFTYLFSCNIWNHYTVLWKYNKILLIHKKQYK